MLRRETKHEGDQSVELHLSPQGIISIMSHADMQTPTGRTGRPSPDLKKGSKEEEDECAVCGQLSAPGLVSPPAPAVPGESCHAGPFCKCPDPGQDVPTGGRGQQLPGVVPLKQLRQTLVAVNGLQAWYWTRLGSGCHEQTTQQQHMASELLHLSRSEPHIA